MTNYKCKYCGENHFTSKHNLLKEKKENPASGIDEARLKESAYINGWTNKKSNK